METSVSVARWPTTLTVRCYRSEVIFLKIAVSLISVEMTH